ncbi:MAG: hypothetical protein V1846_02085 [Candidatus Komeilibacteria bacterium]
MPNIMVFCQQPDGAGYIEHALRVAEGALTELDLINEAVFDAPKGYNPRRFRDRSSAPYVRVFSSTEGEAKTIADTMHMIDSSLDIEPGTLDGFIEGKPPQAT